MKIGCSEIVQAITMFLFDCTVKFQSLSFLKPLLYEQLQSEYKLRLFCKTYARLIYYALYDFAIRFHVFSDSEATLKAF